MTFQTAPSTAIRLSRNDAINDDVACRDESADHVKIPIEDRADRLPGPTIRRSNDHAQERPALALSALHRSPASPNRSRHTKIPAAETGLSKADQQMRCRRELQKPARKGRMPSHPRMLHRGTIGIWQLAASKGNSRADAPSRWASASPSETGLRCS